jgi:hypothetical protein
MNQVGLQTVIDTLKTSGVNMTSEFQILLMRKLSKLLFSTQATIAKSKAILEKLSIDLHLHASNTADIINSAVEELNKVVLEHIAIEEGIFQNHF